MMENGFSNKGWTDYAEYLPIDRSIIGLLYDSRFLSGMIREQVENILAGGL